MGWKARVDSATDIAPPMTTIAKGRSSGRSSYLNVKMQRQFNPELLGGVAAQHARHHDVIDVGAR